MSRSRRRGLFLLSTLFMFWFAAGRAAMAAAPAIVPSGTGAPILEQGEIAGAKFTIARPVNWNRRVLLLAHGLRSESLPLVADLFPGHLAYQALLDEGWMVAKTSYRRNGMIIADAIADLDALRDHIAVTYGTPERVLLEGESMGGLIGTLIAERGAEHVEGELRPYQGIVAIGAALGAQESNMTLGLSLQPRIPVIFLTNQSELDGPKTYVNAPRPRTDPETLPVLFRVSRSGHVNVNQRERLVALRALNAWLDSGRGALPQPAKDEPFFDATVPPAAQPSQVTLQADARGFEARVTEISSDYGNVFLNAQPADFSAAGIRPMTWFQLKVGAKTYRVRYGRDFDSVKRGEWVAFPNADGLTWLARNFGNASATAVLNLGDPVTLRRYDDPKVEVESSP
jgi:pimeloyl-ACP methyl ester carboxylesterase